MSSLVGRSVGSLKNVPIKPIMSANPTEARRRVLTLYKQWYRAVPKIITTFKLPYTKERLQNRIREEFLKNSHIRDVRAIDMLVIKGEMDLQETLLKWKQECHMKELFQHETAIRQPTDFLGKFFSQK
ncbi:NADH dehydrogenase [ubiquinone] 1 alpha subcomplex subunit 6-like [Clavelina lepadiformis]|uniref:NADH dehydrogenase [ubiquinone] 1 alpha subcomplex subunit 6 n=1 Tax=Clavelina lepadiformis TaxID=159417 RepID=A0ABP0FDV3_CLALP